MRAGEHWPSSQEPCERGAGGVEGVSSDTLSLHTRGADPVRAITVSRDCLPLGGESLRAPQDPDMKTLE